MSTVLHIHSLVFQPALKLLIHFASRPIYLAGRSYSVLLFLSQCKTLSFQLSSPRYSQGISVHKDADTHTSWRHISNVQTDATAVCGTLEHTLSNPHVETKQISATGKCLRMTLVCGKLTLPLQQKVKGSTCFPLPFSPLFFFLQAMVS